MTNIEASLEKEEVNKRNDFENVDDPRLEQVRNVFNHIKQIKNFLGLFFDYAQEKGDEDLKKEIISITENLPKLEDLLHNLEKDEKVDFVQGNEPIDRIGNFDFCFSLLPNLKKIEEKKGREHESYKNLFMGFKKSIAEFNDFLENIFKDKSPEESRRILMEELKKSILGSKKNN
ncbi:MAG: hypothetical protein ABIA02_02860 [Candidatus Falkowbacteria bacterium]